MTNPFLKILLISLVTYSPSFIAHIHLFVYFYILAFNCILILFIFMKYKKHYYCLYSLLICSILLKKISIVGFLSLPQDLIWRKRFMVTKVFGIYLVVYHICIAWLTDNYLYIDQGYLLITIVIFIT